MPYQSIWSKVLDYMIISSRKHSIFMQFFWVFLVGPVTLKKQMKASVQVFFWSNHRIGLVFKTMPLTPASEQGSKQATR
jgi:hypothetical protein